MLRDRAGPFDGGQIVPEDRGVVAFRILRPVKEEEPAGRPRALLLPKGSKVAFDPGTGFFKFGKMKEILVARKALEAYFVSSAEGMSMR